MAVLLPSRPDLGRAVQRLNDWIGARRHAIPPLVLAVFGVLLILTGMGKM